jgi:hypothetical protein
MNSERERVISISLTEVEWQAFVACQPRPVDWLRARIVEAVAASSGREEREEKRSRHRSSES